jgi:hypothetical protein
MRSTSGPVGRARSAGPDASDPDPDPQGTVMNFQLMSAVRAAAEDQLVRDAERARLIATARQVSRHAAAAQPRPWWWWRDWWRDWWRRRVDLGSPSGPNSASQPSGA